MKTLLNKLILKKSSNVEKLSGLDLPTSSEESNIYEVVEQGPDVKTSLITKQVKVDSSSDTFKETNVNNEKHYICEEKDILIILN